MKYTLTDYQGKELTIEESQARKIAEVSELIEVTINGQVHYLNKANIASIRPQPGAHGGDMDLRQLKRAD